MRLRRLLPLCWCSVVASCASATAPDPAETPDMPHLPLRCEPFQRDKAFDELTNWGGTPIDNAADLAGSAKGTYYVPVQTRFDFSALGRSGVARWSGAWTVEKLVDRWEQFAGVWASAEDDAWLVGEAPGPAVAHRIGGTWRRVEPPAGATYVGRVGGQGKRVFVIAGMAGSPSSASVSDFRLWRREGEGWAIVDLPLGTEPGGLWALDDDHLFVWSLMPFGTTPRPTRLFLQESGAFTEIVLPADAPPVTSMSGTSMDDLLVHCGPRVYWLTDRGRRWKLVHDNRHPYGRIWSPRPGTALLLPDYGDGPNLTILDGELGPRPLVIDAGAELFMVRSLWVENDRRTLHLMAIPMHGYRNVHYRTRCE